LRIYIELAGLIFAAGVTYSAIQSNKTLDELVEKIDPIVEVAIRGNEHMADDTTKGAHTRSGRH
jgi:hypothetical protein